MKLLLLVLLGFAFLAQIQSQQIITALLKSWDAPSFTILERAPHRHRAATSSLRRPQTDYSEVEREGPINADHERDGSETSEVEIEPPVRNPNADSDAEAPSRNPSSGNDADDGDDVETIVPAARPTFGGSGGHDFGPSLFDALFPPRPSFVSPFNPNRFIWHFSKPWWMRDNVCVDNKVIEDAQKNPESDEPKMVIPIHISSKKCHEKDDAYVCTTQLLSPTENKTTITTYQCCIGYRLDAEQGVCVVDILRDVNDTLSSLGCNKLASLLAEEQASKRIADVNVTIFAPTDESLVDFEDDTNKRMNEIPVLSDQSMNEDHLSDMVKHHVVNGMFRLADLHNSMMLPTLDNSSSVRINIYRNYRQPEVVTANCVPLTVSNVRAKNAIVHVVSGVLQHPTQSVMDILSADSRFSTFVELLKKSDMLDMFAKSEKGYTVVAPTNAAFEKLDPAMLESFRNGDGCVDRVLQAHLIHSYICRPAIITSYWHRSVVFDKVYFTRQDNKIFVNDMPVLESEKMATDGIIYPVDSVMIPESAKPLSSVINPSVASNFLAYMNETGMMAELDRMKNYTFFIPMDPFNGTDMESSEFMNHHLVSSITTPKGFYNNKMIEARDGSKLRLNNLDLIPAIPGMFSHSFAQCSLIVKGPITACGGVSYVVSSPLAKSAANVVASVENKPTLSIFHELLMNSTAGNKLSEESGPFTVLAPSDEAIQNGLKSEELEQLRSDADEREKFVRRHILPQNLCCMMMRLSGANRAVDGTVLFTHIDPDDNIKLVSHTNLVTSSLTECDNVATNGVVHIINRPLYGGRPNVSRRPIFF